MIRNGVYTLYQGKEYMLGETILENEPIKYWIKSMDSNDLANGFYLYERPKTMIIKGVEYELPPREIGKPNVYLKDITPSEVDEVYHINTLAEYKNVTMAVIGENDTQYLLYIGDEVGNGLGFENIGRSEYQKWINKEDVANVHEVKRPASNFFGS
ncbi:hypothetical protein [Neisseria sp. Ec49-e6-T10]|uniref:hypothetical protein n=1 Tax=Neisseria sp. Ec49-e6-T10 TaxID=3140744 RepID=UPI003EB6E4B2